MIHEGRFDDTVAVVTGAAQGIGEAVATGLAREGGSVVLVDRSELVMELDEKLRAAGSQTLGVLGDLEQFRDCTAVMAAAHERFGRIDVLINNVGGTIWAKPYAEYSPEEIETEIRRSLFPTLWCCRAVLPYMLERRAGTIVNVSSVATRGVNRVPYAAAKGGVNALTASLAFEYADQGIRVVAVAPGGTEAPERRIPRGTRTEKSAQEQAWYQAIVDQTVESSLMKRYGTIQEQAAVILFMASREASYLTGVRLPVAGGDLG